MVSSVGTTQAAPVLANVSPALAPGDAVCSASNSAAEVIKVYFNSGSDTFTIDSAKSVVGIAVAPASPGDMVQLAYPGSLVSNSITALAPGDASFVAIDQATGRMMRSMVHDGSEYLVGVADTQGNVTLLSEFGPIQSTGTQFVLNVKRFGAIGNNIKDDTDAIQNAIMACQHSLASGGASAGGLSGTYTGFTIFFPRGVYRVTGIDVNAFMWLKGDGNAEIICTDPTRATILIGLAYAGIENLHITGGRWCVQLTGASRAFNGYLGNKENYNNSLVIRDCSLRCSSTGATTEIAIYMGGLTFQNRQIGGQLLVENCEIATPAVFWGGADNVVFRDCFITIYTPDESAFPLEGHYGLGLATFTSGGVLTVDSVAIAPNVAAVPAGKDPALFQGCGHFRILNCRLGGETQLTVGRYSQHNIYNGEILPIEPDGGSDWFFDKCGISCTNRWHLFEAFDGFPLKLKFQNCTGAIAGTTVYNTKTLQTLTAPIWLEDTVALSDMNKSGNDMEIELDFVDADVASRFIQSDLANRLTWFNTDVTEWFRQFVIGRASLLNGPAISNQVGVPTRIPRNNLWFQGHVDWFASVSGIVTNWIASGTDCTTGYTLTNMRCTASGSFSLGSVGGVDVPTQINISLHGDGGAGFWGANLRAGNYVFSVYVKVDQTTTVLPWMGFAGPSYKYAKPFVIEPSGSYRRIWFPFYFDGIQQIQFGISTDNTSRVGTNMSAGLMMINKGLEPADYVFPGYDPTVGPRSNLTAEGYICCTYYGTSEPTSGTFKKGDMTINIDPTAGGIYGWVCTTAGTPGTHKAIAIAL